MGLVAMPASFDASVGSPVLNQAIAAQIEAAMTTVTEKTAEAPLDQESKQRQSREEEAWRQQSRRRRQQADDATFEVTV